jgi:hypothetical protein
MWVIETVLQTAAPGLDGVELISMGERLRCLVTSVRTKNKHDKNNTWVVVGSVTGTDSAGGSGEGSQCDSQGRIPRSHLRTDDDTVCDHACTPPLIDIVEIRHDAHLVCDRSKCVDVALLSRVVVLRIKAKMVQEFQCHVVLPGSTVLGSDMIAISP